MRRFLTASDFEPLPIGRLGKEAKRNIKVGKVFFAPCNCLIIGGENLLDAKRGGAGVNEWFHVVIVSELLICANVFYALLITKNFT